MRVIILLMIFFSINIVSLSAIAFEVGMYDGRNSEGNACTLNVLSVEVEEMSGQTRGSAREGFIAKRTTVNVIIDIQGFSSDSDVFELLSLVDVDNWVASLRF